jgi:GT2 family glycosyltransferase
VYLRGDEAVRITLCIGTRDRAELFVRHLLPCLRALPAWCSAVVVDQSTTARIADQVYGLDRFVYRRSEEVGLSRARNLAVRTTAAPLLAFTDDDVSFEPSWLEGILALFESHPEEGVVCGRAVTSDGKPVLGKAKPPGVYRWPTSPFGLGWGLNMAFRRDALVAAGAFDEELGAGARFPAGEDTDMLYRVMRAGWGVVCSDELIVTHHDWRSRREKVRLHYAYGLGVGAQTAKHTSAGDRKAIWMALRLQAHLPRTILLLRPRYGLRHLLFSVGMAVGFIRWRRDHGGRSAGSRVATETDSADQALRDRDAVSADVVAESFPEGRSRGIL